MGSVLFFRGADIRNYVQQFFEHFRIPGPDAAIAADAIIQADLGEIASHGTSKLHQYYGNRLQAGRINTQSQLRVIRETANTACYDGGNGIGPVLATRAMEACIAKARERSVGIVTVCNSNHFCIAGYYAMMALEHKKKVGVANYFFNFNVCL